MQLLCHTGTCYFSVGLLSIAFSRAGDGRYQAMLKDGAKAYRKIDVPAHGDYTLRIGVHDLTSDHVGALEVPTSAIAAAR